MPPPPLTRAQLDQLHCGDPQCDNHDGHAGLFFVPRCHPDADLTVFYHHGALTLICAECDAAFAMIAVADPP